MASNKIPLHEKEAIGDELVALSERIRRKFNLTIPEAKQELREDLDTYL